MRIRNLCFRIGPPLGLPEIKTGDNVLTQDDGAFDVVTNWTCDASPTRWSFILYYKPFGETSFGIVRNLLVNGTKRTSNSGLTISPGDQVYATIQGQYPEGLGPLFTTATVTAPPFV